MRWQGWNISCRTWQVLDAQQILILFLFSVFALKRNTNYKEFYTAIHFFRWKKNRYYNILIVLHVGKLVAQTDERTCPFFASFTQCPMSARDSTKSVTLFSRQVVVWLLFDCSAGVAPPTSPICHSPLCTIFTLACQTLVSPGLILGWCLSGICLSSPMAFRDQICISSTNLSLEFQVYVGTIYWVTPQAPGTQHALTPSSSTNSFAPGFPTHLTTHPN